ncbi:MAG: DnaK suppressor protein [Parcubacteria group bacterium Athens0714_16]|nr:MAG: DnaK suppressor protein [Parcubacteria group bacterium Athens0714_16]
MEKNKLEKYKNLLESELKLLENELNSVGRKNPDNLKDWEAEPDEEALPSADSTDYADEIEEFEGNAAILKELEIKYNETKKALEKMKNGTYGICDVCGKEIPEARLDANPSATTCLEHVK